MVKPPARLHIVPLQISDVKWKKALNSDYLLFVSPSEDEKNEAGLYYARIDFTQIGRKEPNKLLDAIKERKTLIENLNSKELVKWDVEGNDHVLAVAYSVKSEGETISKLMILTSPEGGFVECDIVDHSQSKVNAIEIIVPFSDSDITHVVYGLSNGIDVNGH